MSWQAAASFDPWAPHDDVDMLDNDLGLMDYSDEEYVQITLYKQSSPGWITQAKAHAFIHGCRSTEGDAKKQAYQALRTPNSAQSFPGLDHTLGQCKVVDKDAGYDTSDQSGHVPDHAAIVRRLLQHQDLIDQCDMVYLIVDNRSPTQVDYWPAFARWWSSRRHLVGPQGERTDVLWIQADQQTWKARVKLCPSLANTFFTLAKSCLIACGPSSFMHSAKQRLVLRSTSTS